MSRIAKGFVGFFTIAFFIGILYALSAAASWAVCFCFGLGWTWRTGIGVMIIWVGLYLTLHIFFYGIMEDEDEEV